MNFFIREILKISEALFVNRQRLKLYLFLFGTSSGCHLSMASFISKVYAGRVPSWKENKLPSEITSNL